MFTIKLVQRADGIMAFDKPAGMDTNSRSGQWTSGYPNLVESVYARYPYCRFLNRIDLPTSGLVLFAEDAEMRGYLSRIWQAHDGGHADKRRKIYLCRTQTPPWSEFVADRDIPGKGPACTAFKVTYNDMTTGTSLLQAELVSHGRTHQIRRHLKMEGLPILGDLTYKGPPSDRLHLHAWRNEVVLEDGRVWKAEAPIPEWGLPGDPPLDEWQVGPLTEEERHELKYPQMVPDQRAQRPAGMSWQEWKVTRPYRSSRGPHMQQQVGDS